jgi:GLPGLI family protein
MKQVLNILCILFPILVIAQNSSIEITYVKAYKNHKDTTATAPKILKNIEYEFKCNTNESRFEYISSMSSDGDETNKRFIGKGGGKGVFYKNLSEQQNFLQIDFLGEIFLISESFNKYKWELRKDKTKKILGYDCYMAIGSFQEYNSFKKKTVTVSVDVWYAPGIPVPFGPSGYDGLPGLVLESNTGSFRLIAKDIKFIKSKIDIEKSDEGKKVTRKELNKIGEEIIRTRMTENKRFKKN